MNYPFVSIIIPVGNYNKNLEECIRYCRSLDYPNYEIIVLPDEKFNYDNNIKIIPTGHTGPAAKRNIGIEHARGEIIAFIDDDTYPLKDWLKKAVRNFSDPTIAAVGGPSVTPDDDNLLQKASGAVYESLIGGGIYRFRYTPGGRRFVDDYPSCNFIVRKDVLEKIRGFQTNVWPGEDTALCLDIVYKLGGKIVYDSEAFIFHHRRELFKGHLRQIKAYALHRGYFAKRYPKTSFRLSYFLPSIFTLFLMFGWIINFKLYLLGILIYLALCIISVCKFKKIKILTLFGIISTHIVYGIWFIAGLFVRKLREECV